MTHSYPLYNTWDHADPQGRGGLHCWGSADDPPASISLLNQRSRGYFVGTKLWYRRQVESAKQQAETAEQHAKFLEDRLKSAQAQSGNPVVLPVAIERDAQPTPDSASTEPRLRPRTPLEDSQFNHLKIAFANLTVPQQYALKLVFHSARTLGYIPDDELELALKARGCGLPIGAGIVGPLNCSDFVEQKPNGRISLRQDRLSRSFEKPQ